MYAGRSTHAWCNPGLTGLAVLLLLSLVPATLFAQDSGQRLRQWAASGQIQAIQDLLSASEQVDVNSPDETGWTALVYAARAGHDAVVQLLLHAGAKVNLANAARETALHQAARYGRTETARLLLEAGADFEARDADGRTPLFWAINGEHAGIVELLRARAVVNAYRRSPVLALAGEGDTTPPTLVEWTDAPYPDEALETGTEGTVVLMALVRRDGSVGAVSVSRSLTESLDRSALRTVRTWKFEPATRAGEPVDVIVEIDVDFHQETRPTFSMDVSAVSLDVVVTDAGGRFVGGLAQEDFLVLDEGIPQEVQFFTAEVTPVTVLVLLDSSASVRANLREVQRAANRFINRLARGDVARIGFFHSHVVFGPRFTSDIKEHVAMINQMQPQRSTHLYDALIAALRELSTVEGRKALLVFTDGDDEGSRASLEDALDVARRSHVSIYAVGLIGWSSAGGMSVRENLLTQVAEYTGGRGFFPTDEREMRTAFDRISDELHRQYRMVYFPSNVEGKDGWHSVEVRMTRRKNLVVRTRLGYYRPPEPVKQER